MQLKNIVSVSLVLLIILLVGCDMLPEPQTCEKHSDCSERQACEDGECHMCGNSAGRVCCEGDKCEEGLVCDKGDCRACGTNWEHCCDGNTCEEGLECDSYGICHECGTYGDVCCDGDICNMDCLECNPDKICRTKSGYTASYGAACVSRG